jgi:hypothetical protein
MGSHQVPAYFSCSNYAWQHSTNNTSLLYSSVAVPSDKLYNSVTERLAWQHCSFWTSLRMNWSMTVADFWMLLRIYCHVPFVNQSASVTCSGSNLAGVACWYCRQIRNWCANTWKKRREAHSVCIYIFLCLSLRHPPSFVPVTLE